MTYLSEPVFLRGTARDIRVLATRARDPILFAKLNSVATEIEGRADLIEADIKNRP
jgi:hypothetical protein